MNSTKTKKEYNVKPKEAHKKVLDNLVENGGNKYKAILDAGFSETTAKTPSKVLDSRGFQELLDKTISDKLASEKLKALIEKEEVVVRNNVTSGEIEVIPTGQIDVQAVKAGLDMLFKLKGAYAPEKRMNLNANVTIKKEHEDIAEKYEEDLRRQYLD